MQSIKNKGTPQMPIPLCGTTTENPLWTFYQNHAALDQVLLISRLTCSSSSTCDVCFHSSNFDPSNLPSSPLFVVAALTSRFLYASVISSWVMNVAVPVTVDLIDQTEWFSRCFAQKIACSYQEEWHNRRISSSATGICKAEER